MQKFKSLIKKFASVFVIMALVIGVSTSNSACFIVYHQPKEPEAMNKFKF